MPSSVAGAEGIQDDDDDGGDNNFFKTSGIA